MDEVVANVTAYDGCMIFINENKASDE